MTPWLIAGFTLIVVYYLDRLEHRYLKSIFDWLLTILLAILSMATGTFWGMLTIYLFRTLLVVG